MHIGARAGKDSSIKREELTYGQGEDDNSFFLPGVWV